MKARATTRRLATLLLGLAALAVGPLTAQQRGGTRRALVVGISRYRSLPQLNYAAADAELFYDFLRSKAAGSLPDSNIRKLLNEQATAPRIREDLAWLLQASKPGDEAIIYFAGLGDAETLTGMQTAFLLATDASPSNYFAGGAVEVNVLGQFASGITRKGATVLVVTDASRAGKLMDEDGAKRTTAALLEAWNGVTKLVSSSPDQSSWEGTQWGGGHGVFTWFLVEGLEGLADANGDGVVTLGELWRYVDDNVMRETAGRQTPASSGDYGHTVAVVDTATLRAARARMTSR